MSCAISPVMSTLSLHVTVWAQIEDFAIDDGLLDEGQKASYDKISVKCCVAGLC